MEGAIGTREVKGQNAQVEPISIVTTGFVLCPAAMEATTTTMEEQHDMLVKRIAKVDLCTKRRRRVNANAKKDLFLSLMTTEFWTFVNRFLIGLNWRRMGMTRRTMLILKWRILMWSLWTIYLM